MSSVTLDEGRYYTLPDGERLPSVTTILRRLHSFPLENWKMAKVAEYVARDPELHALAYSDGYAAAKQALQRGPNKGSALHGASEMIDVGHAVEGMPEIIALQSMGYKNAMLAHQVKMVKSEITVVNVSKGYAGRFDRITQIPAVSSRNYLSDVKSAKSVYPEVAMQLAAYANAEFILEKGELIPMIEVDLDTAFVIHIGDEKTTLVPVDISDAWLAFQGLLVTVAWQDGPAKRVVGKPLAAPPIDPEVLAKAKAKRDRAVKAAVDKLKETGEPQPSPPPAETAIGGEPTSQAIQEDPETSAALKASLVVLARDLTDYLRNQFVNMPEDARREVLALWPTGLKGFKAARESGYAYTFEEIEKIEAVIVAISAKRQLPFPMEDRPGLPEKKAKPETPKKATKKTAGTVNRIGACIVCGTTAATVDEKGNPLHAGCSKVSVNFP